MDGMSADALANLTVMRDRNAASPDTASGFVTPAGSGPGPIEAHIIALAEGTGSAMLARRARNVFGAFTCLACGRRSHMTLNTARESALAPA